MVCLASGRLVVPLARVGMLDLAQVHQHRRRQRHHEDAEVDLGHRPAAGHSCLCVCDSFAHASDPRDFDGEHAALEAHAAARGVGVVGQRDGAAELAVAALEPVVVGALAAAEVAPRRAPASSRPFDLDGDVASPPTPGSSTATNTVSSVA